MYSQKSYIFFFLCTITFSINAQQGYLLPNNTLSRALSHAGTAYDGGEAIYINQAGLASLKDVYVDFNFIRNFNIAQIDQISLSINKNTPFGVWGIMVTHMGDAFFNEQLFGVGYAKKLSSKFALGGRFNLIRYNVAELGSKNLPTFEIGFITSLSQKLTLGTHIFNPTTLSLNENETIPTHIRIGWSYAFSSKTHLFMDYIQSIQHSPSVPIGIIYRPHERLKIVFGSNFLKDYYSFGIQLTTISHMNVAMGVEINQSLGTTPFTSLSYIK